MTILYLYKLIKGIIKMSFLNWFKLFRVFRVKILCTVYFFLEQDCDDTVQQFSHRADYYSSCSFSVYMLSRFFHCFHMLSSLLINAYKMTDQESSFSLCSLSIISSPLISSVGVVTQQK